jgi:hypothetical protein
MSKHGRKIKENTYWLGSQECTLSHPKTATLIRWCQLTQFPSKLQGCTNNHLVKILIPITRNEQNVP